MTEHSCLTAARDRPPHPVADRARATDARRVDDLAVTIASGFVELTRALRTAEAA